MSVALPARLRRNLRIGPLLRRSNCASTRSAESEHCCPFSRHRNVSLRRIWLMASRLAKLR